MKAALYSLVCSLLLSAPLASEAQLLWTVGIDDNDHPMGDGGGPNASFVQENGTINPLPGVPNSPEVNQQADNDYYLAGSYTTAIPSVIAFYGDYTPVGEVAVNEEAAERAFAASDNDLRFHFNLPDTLQPTNFLSVTFDAVSLHTDGQSDPRYGIEVYFNGVLVQTQIVIRPPQMNVDYTTPVFTLESVNAQVGAGFDNIVSLKGINYNNDGGGNWMGIDYVQLNMHAQFIPPPVFPLAIGLNDDDHPVGDGGGPNATFVQENGTINPLPGVPNSPEVDRQADNDYYFAGNYTTVIAGNGAYTPVGLVPVNEEAAERAFAGDDLDLRYHFNLPNTLSPSDRVAISFDALSLDDSAGLTDRRFGVEVYFNGVKVQPEVVIRPGQLGVTFTTPSFTLGSVNAAVGSGPDNIVSLRGISYANEGGGNWMGIDYVQVNLSTNSVLPPILPWQVGLNDDGWPEGDGGGPNAAFIPADNFNNPLPGNPLNDEGGFDADDDYYFGGAYTSVIPGNGTYTPAGLVYFNEEAIAREFIGTDNERRIHFNLPTTLQPEDVLAVTFDPLSLDFSGSDPRYGVEVYFNGVLVMTQLVIRPAQLGIPIMTAQFTAASVNAQVGPGFDNIVTLRGISYSDQNGGNTLGLDFVRLTPFPRLTFPLLVGRDDNGWPTGNGGGPNTSFVQENGGINALPGRPDNPEVNQQGDNDYYFAGEYRTTIDSAVAYYGAYTPVGLVLANEEGAERAFAAADNDLRYHFNLPTEVSPEDVLYITFDANNLDQRVEIPDPRYGVEVYFNGVQVMTQTVIRPAQLGIDYRTPGFTASSVNAQIGAGFDNIVSLKGINYDAEGGGNWMGIDYVQIHTFKPGPFPWTVGRDDNAWPVGDFGGANASFVQENGTINPLPGAPTSLAVVEQDPPRMGGDNDYYFAGDYSTLIDSVVARYGTYTPVGLVTANEGGAERAFANADNDLRYHFNLPTSLGPDDVLSVTFDALNLHQDGTTPDSRYGVEVYFNGVLVQTQIVIRPAQLGIDYTTPSFTLASVNARTGLGFDNVVSLRGISYAAEGGGSWMGIDYVQLNEGRPQFLPAAVSGGTITLNWIGGGQLEWSPTITGPWTPISPAPSSGYSEAVVAGQNRFYRLKK
jgi:hypothetical protein